LSQHPEVHLCFVNDGSTDGTQSVLQKLCEKFPATVNLISSPKNLGKAEAVRMGMLHCLKNTDFEYIGYSDADLSAPLEEFLTLKNYMTGEIEFCFGSRILKIGSVIERSGKRHYTGRIIATFISNVLDLKVYDTQCGCKLFSRELAAYLFEKHFISTWLFDVEIFARILSKYGKQKALTKMLEIPLVKWINKDGSKVKATYFFKLWIDLLKIKKTLKPEK